MLLRKDKRALVVPLGPGVVEARLKEMQVPYVYQAQEENFFLRFIILGHCLMSWELPNGKVAIGYLKPKDKK